MHVYECVCFPRGDPMVSAAEFLWPAAWQMCVCVCVRSCTHIQVLWDVCRVHDLSLSSSVTIPCLVLLLLWTEWTKWTIYAFLPLFYPQSVFLSCLPCVSIGIAAWSMFLFPLSAPSLTFCHCQISETLKSILTAPFACLTSVCKRHSFVSPPHLHLWVFGRICDKKTCVCTLSPATTPSCF